MDGDEPAGRPHDRARAPAPSPARRPARARSRTSRSRSPTHAAHSQHTTYTLVIAPPVAISGPATLVNWTVNRDYPQTQITATNGVDAVHVGGVGLAARDVDQRRHRRDHRHTFGDRELHGRRDSERLAGRRRDAQLLGAHQQRALDHDQLTARRRAGPPLQHDRSRPRRERRRTRGQQAACRAAWPSTRVPASSRARRPWPVRSASASR